MPSPRVLLLAIFALALLIRGGVACLSVPSFGDDPDAYRVISQSLATTGVYGIVDGHGTAKPTAFRPPLYPYVLSWMVNDGQLTSFSVAILHAVLGAMTVALTFLAAQSCWPDRLPEPRRNLLSCLAALLVAIDPILLQQSTLVMTETLATALAIVIVWWWVTRCRASVSVGSAAVLGLLMALAYLCRPTFLVWAGLMFAVLLIQTDTSWSKRVLRTGAFGLVVAIALVGWTMRNQRMLGHPVWATTHGGYTLLLANNPSFYDYLRTGNFGVAWDAERFLTAYSHRYNGDPNTEEFWMKDWKNPATAISIESEIADDRRCYEAARATINRHPQMFAWSCLVRLGRLWSPLPHRSSDRSPLGVYIVGLYYILFTILIVAGLWRLRFRVGLAAWWPAITLAIALSGVHAVYWSNMRMRAPAVPPVAIVAAAAFLPKRIHATATQPCR